MAFNQEAQDYKLKTHEFWHRPILPPCDRYSKREVIINANPIKIKHIYLQYNYVLFVFTTEHVSCRIKVDEFPNSATSSFCPEAIHIRWGLTFRRPSQMWLRIVVNFTAQDITPFGDDTVLRWKSDWPMKKIVHFGTISTYNVQNIAHTKVGVDSWLMVRTENYGSAIWVVALQSCVCPIKCSYVL